ncbi:MAG: amidohydrolase family protein [Bacteroidetes bacterium]|nr:amidohydrolase family protein [Bacteroidota bacterium]
MNFIKADRIFDGERFLESDAVLAVAAAGEIKEITDTGKIDPLKIQTLKGVITPGFVNAHCHTELSHLKNKISQKTGLPGFGKQIIFQRASSAIDAIKEQIATADKEMRDKGIVAVGDICNTWDSFEMKSNSSLYYHSFIELLGLHPDRAETMFDAGLVLLKKLQELGLAGSLAPHAPYSTSLKLISAISNYNVAYHLPSSIHSQESEDETRFFKGITNGFHDLYQFLQMDISWFVPPVTSSLEYFIEALGSQKTILVHNTCSDTRDINLTKGKNILWCFCPGANLYIEDRLPDFNLFLHESERICLGTDSLASNTGLSIINEANLVLKNSSFSTEQVLKMMTLNGAKALCIEDNYGKLSAGKKMGLNLIDIDDNQFKLIKTL